MPAHTFVIAAYGHSPYLEACVQSLLAQTHKSLIVMATSTPTNHSRQLAARYGLAYHVNPQPNAGIAADWNFALSIAQTPLVTIAHQDDVYEPDYAASIIRQLATYATNHPLIVFTNYHDMVADATRPPGLNARVKSLLLLPFVFSKSISNKFIKKLITLFGDPVCCPSVTFNMPALKNFQFSPQYTVALDWLAWYQLAKQPGTFLYIDKKLVRHRIHPGAETARQIENGNRKAEELKILRLMWGKTLGSLMALVYAAGHKENS